MTRWLLTVMIVIIESHKDCRYQSYMERANVTDEFWVWQFQKPFLQSLMKWDIFLKIEVLLLSHAGHCCLPKEKVRYTSMKTVPRTKLKGLKLRTPKEAIRAPNDTLRAHKGTWEASTGTIKVSGKNSRAPKETLRDLRGTLGAPKYYDFVQSEQRERG